MYGKLLSAVTTADASIRLMSTANGYVVTSRERPIKDSSVPFIGMPSARWVFRTEGAARACVDFIAAFQRAWEAMVRGEPSQELLAEAERLSALSRETVEKLNDHPVIGDPTDSE